MSFTYQTQFILDKAHFVECYEQSAQQVLTPKHFVKAILLVLVGMTWLMFFEVSAYLSWFMVGLGIIDALAVYYQKPWWVARQMLSKAAKGEVTLIIDDDGVTTQSAYLNNTINWNDVKQLIPTACGFIIEHNKGRSYLSNQCLDEPAINFLLSKVKAKVKSETT